MTNFYTQLPTMIQEYARLTAEREFASALGRKIRPQSLAKIAAIEARAQSALTPEQLQVALTNVNYLKQEHHSRLAASKQADHIIKMRALADSAHRKMTKGMLGQEDGLTAHQFELLRQGKPVPIKGKGIRWEPAKWDDWARANTRGMGKDGKGLNFKQFDRLMDEIIELKDMGGTDSAVKRLTGRLGKHALHAAQLASAWENDPNRYYVTLAQRQAERGDEIDTDHYVKPSEEDTTRAVIIRAWARTNETPEQDRAMVSDIDTHYLEDEGSLGDMARSFQAHQSAEDDEFERTYRPEVYSEDELEESNADAA